MTKEEFKQLFISKIEATQGVAIEETTIKEQYYALSEVLKDQIYKNWIKSRENYEKFGDKLVFYFSIEFLFGKLLKTNLYNLGLNKVCMEALKELNIDLEEIEKMEPDLGLGNGGLGRLASCFMDSMAALNLPVYGDGIRYKYGFFEQKIVNGYQVEIPDNWLKDRNVWEVKKPHKAVEVRFGGDVSFVFHNGRMVFKHENYEPVMAVPYDIPISGFLNNSANTLRLWSAETKDMGFDFNSFNQGDLAKANEYKYSVEAISEVLYPDDRHYGGKLLRLKQQYFLVSAGIQSIVRSYRKRGLNIKEFHEKIAIHINDTHPAVAIPELMRILMDEEGLSWDEAWEMTVGTISYTNHTILPEALERWSVDLFKKLLPRVYMIIEEINERFCKELWEAYPGDWERIKNMAIISDEYINMAYLAIVGSHSVNGVAKLHTEILKSQVMKNFYEYYLYKFNNKTNGISHRTWLLNANPGLCELITDTLSDGWVRNPGKLTGLLNFKEDSSFVEKFSSVKLKNKEALAKIIKEEQGITLDPNAIFDIHVKRIHEYKRQILNLFHIIDLYNRLLENPDLDVNPRVFLIGGKTAPGYYMAKQIIKLTNTIGEKINSDARIKDKLKLVFLENYRVSLAQKIFAAADVSEQISTASREASGTGNMKFMINGAVTIGTLDGANIEIRDEVGEDNIVIFGLTSREVLDYYQKGGYISKDVYNSDPRIMKIMDGLISGEYPCPVEEFRHIYDNLLVHNDQYFVLKDFAAYVDGQNKINNFYSDKMLWNRMCITNVAKAGFFSSDRTVMEYARDIWKVRGVNR